MREYTAQSNRPAYLFQTRSTHDHQSIAVSAPRQHKAKRNPSVHPSHPDARAFLLPPHRHRHHSHPPDQLAAFSPYQASSHLVRSWSAACTVSLHPSSRHGFRMELGFGGCVCLLVPRRRTAAGDACRTRCRATEVSLLPKLTGVTYAFGPQEL
jgi:hypothetical protein